MKILTIVFLVCFSFVCKAQIKTEPTVLYIVDGVSVRKESIKQEDIFSKDILKGEQLNQLYVNKRLDTVTIIITKKGAKKQYQNKLSAFSRDYQTYIDNHNNNDDDIQYLVHSDPLEKQEVMSFLYKLPQEKIIGVTFTEQPGLNGNAAKKVVIIDTKVGE